MKTRKQQIDELNAKKEGKQDDVSDSSKKSVANVNKNKTPRSPQSSQTPRKRKSNSGEIDLVEQSVLTEEVKRQKLDNRVTRRVETVEDNGENFTIEVRAFDDNFPDEATGNKSNNASPNHNGDKSPLSEYLSRSDNSSLDDLSDKNKEDGDEWDFFFKKNQDLLEWAVQIKKQQDEQRSNFCKRSISETPKSAYHRHRSPTHAGKG